MSTKLETLHQRRERYERENAVKSGFDFLALGQSLSVLILGWAAVSTVVGGVFYLTHHNDKSLDQEAISIAQNRRTCAVAVQTHQNQSINGNIFPISVFNTNEKVACEINISNEQLSSHNPQVLVRLPTPEVLNESAEKIEISQPQLPEHPLGNAIVAGLAIGSLLTGFAVPTVTEALEFLGK